MEIVNTSFLEFKKICFWIFLNNKKITETYSNLDGECTYSISIKISSYYHRPFLGGITGYSGQVSKSHSEKKLY